MRKRAEPIPTFESEAEERRFWESHDFDRSRGLEPGRARAAAQPPTLDDLDLAAPAGEPARADQDRRPQARRSLPVTDQDLARREARRELRTPAAAMPCPLAVGSLDSAITARPRSSPVTIASAGKVPQHRRAAGREPRPDPDIRDRSRRASRRSRRRLGLRRRSFAMFRRATLIVASSSWCASADSDLSTSCMTERLESSDLQSSASLLLRICLESPISASSQADPA